MSKEMPIMCPMCEADFTADDTLGVEVTVDAKRMDKGAKKGSIKLDKDMVNWTIRGLRCLVCNHRISAFPAMVESLYI